MATHAIATPAEWWEARKALLELEKEHTRAKDRLSAKRRALPRVKIDKEYIFEGPDGPLTFADLFEHRSQLIVQHFMFDPDQDDGCPSCSFLADHVDDAFQHLYHHDVSFAAVSRAPYPKIADFKRRKGWKFNWVSSYGTDFNRDFDVSFTQEDIDSGKQLFYNFEPITPPAAGEAPGISVFYKDDSGTIFHTYSAYARGTETVVNAYNFLDLTPEGRNDTRN